MISSKIIGTTTKYVAINLKNVLTTIITLGFYVTTEIKISNYFQPATLYLENNFRVLPLSCKLTPKSLIL